MDDSLADTHSDTGNTDLALIKYRPSLAILPRNDGAAKTLRKDDDRVDEVRLSGQPIIAKTWERKR